MATTRRRARNSGRATLSKRDLDGLARTIANATAASINRRVPPRTEDMPYSRQYVLERVIQLLAAKV